jgi:hypothetical protein
LESTIRAFGLAFSPSAENIKLIEGYIKAADDSIKSSAIKVLCNKSYWGLSEKYLGFLLAIIGRDHCWELSESQIAAFGAIGEYLHDTNSKGVFSVMLSLFDKELADYLQAPDQYFLRTRLENIYLTLDFGIRGRRALIEARVGSRKFPDDISKELMDKVKSKTK